MNLVSSSESNEFNRESTYINIIFGSIWYILVIIMLFITSTENIDLSNSLDLILYLIIIIISSLGYLLILMPDAERKIKSIVGNLNKGKINTWRLLLILLVVIFVLMNLLSGTVKIGGTTDNVVAYSVYFIYVLVPLTLILYLNAFRSKNQKFLICFFIFLWLWWAIEFKGELGIFPNPIVGYSNFLNLVAFITLTWGFFIISDYTISRSFSRLITINNFKVILTW